MANPDLESLFDSLEIPRRADERFFSAAPVPGYSRYRIAKDHVGAPALLIEVAEDGELGGYPVRLSHLQIEHNVRCRIQRSDGSIGINYVTILGCINSNFELDRHFLRVLAPIIQSGGYTPSNMFINETVRNLVELFRSLSERPQRSIQGIWAELFVIVAAHDPAYLIRCWHTDPHELFDFHDGDQRLEVKSTQGEARTHQFRLEQLHLPAGARAIVGSVVSLRAEGGVSVAELIARLHIRGVPAEMLVKVERTVAAALGSDWRAIDGVRFDYGEGESISTTLLVRCSTFRRS